MVGILKGLSEAGVRYLLISGQASVIYGGAEFSEDIDLWAAPSADNLDVLLGALAGLDAVVGRLTPPITEPNARSGHGFHFRVPDSDGWVWDLDIV